jgi:hypothetical protein
VTDPVDLAAWPSHALVTCVVCGSTVRAGTDTAQRFYKCACPGELINSDDLDELVVAAVAEHQARRMARNSFRPQWVRSAWKYADAKARRAMIVTELAGATISHTDDEQLRLLSCLWNADDPDHSTETTGSTPDSRHESGGER